MKQDTVIAAAKAVIIVTAFGLILAHRDPEHIHPEREAYPIAIHMDQSGVTASTSFAFSFNLPSSSWAVLG